MICTSGMIGVGKSTLAKRIAEHFGTEVFYEKVDGKINENLIDPVVPIASRTENDSYETNTNTKLNTNTSIPNGKLLKKINSDFA